MIHDTTTGMEPPINSYNGMNPEFVKKVWAKRRAAMDEETLRRRHEANLRDKKAVWQILKDQKERRDAEAKAQEMRDNPSFDFDAPLVPRISAQKIIEDMAELHGLKVESLKSATRVREVVRARQEAMARVYLARPDMSLPQIGRLFGGRDHTTVLHAIMRMGVHISQTGKRRNGYPVRTQLSQAA